LEERVRHSIFIALISAVVLPQVAVADEAADLFNSLFGQRIAAAKATATKTDDVELAAEILAVVAEAKDSPKLVAIVCKSAFELTSTSRAGYPIAIQAMDLLAEHVPDQRREALEGRVLIRRKLVTSQRDMIEKLKLSQAIISDELELAAGLESEGNLNEATLLLRRTLALARSSRSSQKARVDSEFARLSAKKIVLAKVEVLKTRLKTDAKDATAVEQLVRLYVVDLDDPDSAKKYSFLLKDEVAKANVQIAAKPVATRTASEALKVAQWYSGLAKTGMASQKLRMLKRSAQSYLQSLIASIETGGLAQVQARIALKNTKEAMALSQTEVGDASAQSVSWLTRVAAAYSFDKATMVRNSAKDSATKNRHGRVYGAKSVEGRFGEGISLAGKTSYIHLPPMPLGAGTTISTWVKCDELPAAFARIFDFGSGPFASNMILTFRSAEPRIMFFPDKTRAPGTAASASNIVRGRWVHLVAVFGRDGTGTLYVDGSKRATAKIGIVPIRTRSRMYIGRSNWTEDSPFHGSIDEFVIWQRALSSDELDQMIAYTRGGGSLIEAITTGGVSVKSATKGLTLPEAWEAYFLSDVEKRGEQALPLIQTLGRAGGEAAKINDWVGTLGYFKQALAVAKKSVPARVEGLTKIVKVVETRKAIFDRIAALEMKLEADPDDQSTLRSLIQIHLVELNAPKGAAGLAAKVTDATLKKRLALLAKKPAELEEPQSQDMIAWFKELAAGADDVGKAAMYGRIIRYYRPIIAKHEDEDEAKVAAMTARDKIGELLNALPEEARTAAKVSFVLTGSLKAFAKTVVLLSAGFYNGNRMSIAIDGKTIIAGSATASRGPGRRGITMVAVHDGEVVVAKSFNTSTGSAGDSVAFAAAVDALPKGTYVVLAGADNVARRFSGVAQKALGTLGGKISLLPIDGKYQRFVAYYLIGQKGLEPGEAIEKLDAKTMNPPLVYPEGATVPSAEVTPPAKPITINVPADATFKQFTKLVRIMSAGNATSLKGSGKGGNRMSIAIGGKVVFAGLGYGGSPMLRGLNMIAVYKGKVIARSTFDFYVSKAASPSFAAAVNALPEGALVAIAVADTVGGGAGGFGEDARAAIQSLGGKRGPLKPTHAAYILIGQKGLKAGKGIELYGKKGGPGPIVYPRGAAAPKAPAAPKFLKASKTSAGSTTSPGVNVACQRMRHLRSSPSS
jgi:hypothetical protein